MRMPQWYCRKKLRKRCEKQSATRLYKLQTAQEIGKVTHCGTSGTSTFLTVMCEMENLSRIWVLLFGETVKHSLDIVATSSA